MPYLSRKHQFLFYSAPATGSTAIIAAFEERGIGCYYPESDIVEGDRRLVPRKHATPAQMESEALITDEIRAYTHFVGIRNPFSFHVAKYLRNKTRRLKGMENPNSWINKLPEDDKRRYVTTIKRQSQMTFDEFLRDIFSRYKKPQAIQGNFHMGMSYFIHQESVDDDLRVICEKLPINPPVRTRKVNVTNAMPSNMTYQDYYAQASIDMVYKFNSPSFERFPEYDFDGYHPERSSLRQ